MNIAHIFEDCNRWFYELFGKRFGPFLTYAQAEESARNYQ